MSDLKISNVYELNGASKRAGKGVLIDFDEQEFFCLIYNVGKQIEVRVWQMKYPEPPMPSDIMAIQKAAKLLLRKFRLPVKKSRPKRYSVLSHLYCR